MQVTTVRGKAKAAGEFTVVPQRPPRPDVRVRSRHNGIVFVVPANTADALAKDVDVIAEVTR